MEEEKKKESLEMSGRLKKKKKLPCKNKNILNQLSILLIPL